MTAYTYGHIAPRRPPVLVTTVEPGKRPRCEPCDLEMYADVYAGCFPMRYFCPVCGAATGGTRPEPSVLEAHNGRVPVRWTALMGATEARRAWEIVEREDAEAYERDNPIREGR